jgi:radical SAM superfamily enzyme YgiQ (UPF0313 family)
MNIAFVRPEIISVEREHPQNVTPSFDISYCSAVLEALGHKIFLFDGELKKIDYEELERFFIRNNLEICVFEVVATNLEESISVAKNLKKFCKKMIALGPQPTAMPESLVFEGSPFDLCVVGEPESTIVEAVESKKIENIAGTAFHKKRLILNKPRPLISDLDTLPFPTNTFSEGYAKFYPIGNLPKAKFGFILGSRGCPFSCTYCSPTLRVSYGKKMRYRSIENVLDEIASMVSGGVNAIFFVDDLFTFNKKWVMDLCDGIIERGIRIPWLVQTRVDLVDKKMLEKMREAGCSTFCVGIESGCDRILNITNKKMTRDTIISSFKMLKEFGFLISAYFIIGNPTETAGEVLETIKLAKYLDPDMIQVA